MHPDSALKSPTTTVLDPGEVAGIKPSILLVEDEPSTRLMVARQLTRAGYLVESVTNGAEAIATLKRRFYPLLITDWDMPEMNGVALCKAVRELPLEGYVYTILLSAREGTANVVEGLAAGADDYLTKPTNENELRARLNTGQRILKLEQSLRAANRHIQLLSMTDALTGTFNRRHLMDRLPQEIARVRRYGRPFSVVLCDVDHFKDVNDVYGHQVGDQVLRSFAQLLVNFTRKDIDWVVRYGGEEFIIALPETSVANALAVAETIRSEIATHLFEFTDGVIKISASFGVAGYDSLQAQEEASVDKLIARADVCLYQSKKLGRNRVTGEILNVGGSPIPPST